MAEKTKSKKENTDPPVWEWILAAIGLVLVSGAIGTMIYRAAWQEMSPPNLIINVESISPASNGYVVEFRVKNTGSQTAAGLNIEGNLIKAGEKIETSTATLTYAPAYSERQGGMFFTKDPRNFELQIRALSYEKP